MGHMEATERVESRLIIRKFEKRDSATVYAMFRRHVRSQSFSAVLYWYSQHSSEQAVYMTILLFLIPFRTCLLSLAIFFGYLYVRAALQFEKYLNNDCSDLLDIFSSYMAKPGGCFWVAELLPSGVKDANISLLDKRMEEIRREEERMDGNMASSKDGEVKRLIGGDYKGTRHPSEGPESSGGSHDSNDRARYNNSRGTGDKNLYTNRRQTVEYGGLPGLKIERMAENDRGQRTEYDGSPELKIDENNSFHVEKESRDEKKEKGSKQDDIGSKEGKREVSRIDMSRTVAHEITRINKGELKLSKSVGDWGNLVNRKDGDGDGERWPYVSVSPDGHDTELEPTNNIINNFIESILTKIHFLSVGKEPGSTIVGCIGLLPLRGEPSTAQLVRLVVSPRARRLHIGSKLLEKFESFVMTQLQYTDICLYSNNLNRAPIRFAMQHKYNLVQITPRSLMRGNLIKWVKNIRKRDTQQSSLRPGANGRIYD